MNILIKFLLYLSLIITAPIALVAWLIYVTTYTLFRWIPIVGKHIFKLFQIISWLLGISFIITIYKLGWVKPKNYIPLQTKKIMLESDDPEIVEVAEKALLDMSTKNKKTQKISSSGSEDYDLMWHMQYSSSSTINDPELEESFTEIRELIGDISNQHGLKLSENEFEQAFNDYYSFLSQNPRLGVLQRQVSAAYCVLCMYSSMERISGRPLIDEERKELMKLVKKYDPIGREWQQRFSWTI